MKVAILCVCSMAMGFLAGRNRQINLATAVPLELKSESTASSIRKQSSRDKSSTDFEATYREIKSGPSRRFNSRLSELARGVPLERAGAALDAAREVMTSFEFTVFSGEVFSRWAEADPAGLIAYAETLTTAQGRDEALSNGLAELAYVSPAEAAQYVEALPRIARRNLIETILPGIASTDPERALSLLTNVTVSQRFSAKSEILNAIAESNPQAAFDFFERHKNDPAFGRDERLLDGPLQTWIGKDPNAAAAWLASQPEAFQKRHTEEAARALQGVAETDPMTAAALIAKLPSSSDRKYSFGYAVSTWCQRAPEECKAWLDQQTDPALKGAGLAAYAAHLVKSDASAAMDVLLSVPNLSSSEGYVHSVFSALAETNPQAALANREKISDESARNSALAGAISGWAMTSPQSAAEYALTLQENEGGMWPIHETIANFLLDDPASSLEWLRTVPADSAARNNAIQRAVQELSNASPELAAQFAALLPAEDFGPQFTHIGQRWAQANPEEAIVLASTLPDEACRAAALAGALGVWAQSAPFQAAAYLQHLDGDELEQGTRAVVQSMSNQDPLATAQWVQNFPERLFREALPQFLDNWIAANRRDAESWIKSLPNGTTRDFALNYLPEVAAAAAQ